MDALDKTLLASNEVELKQVYEEEVKRLNENEFKMKILKCLCIEDFSRDLPEISKKNIEKALLAVQIRDHINIGGDQKVLGELDDWLTRMDLRIVQFLGLDSFDMSKINLSFTEKKLIRETVTHLIDLERQKNAHKKQSLDALNKDVEETQQEFKKLVVDNTTAAEKLAELKRQELELMKEVADALVSPAQKNLVKAVLDDSKIAMMQLNALENIIGDSDSTRTTHSQKAFKEIIGHIDEQLQEKRNKQ